MYMYIFTCTCMYVQIVHLYLPYQSIAVDIVKDSRGRAPLVLVMTPTRELANQIKSEFDALSQGLSVFCIYGGVPYEPQGTYMYMYISSDMISFNNFCKWNVDIDQVPGLLKSLLHVHVHLHCDCM